jgi:hypothetical protein
MMHSTTYCFNEKYVDDENEKSSQLTVDDVFDEQDFILEDEVTEDSTDQIELKQFPSEEGEYNAKFPPFSAQKSHSAGVGWVPEIFLGWNPIFFVS